MGRGGLFSPYEDRVVRFYLNVLSPGSEYREEIFTVVQLPKGIVELVLEPSRADSFAVEVGVGLATEFVI